MENYYDLTNVETQKWQVELAKKYGVYGFCMYHYWFNGHLLLEKPVNQYLEHKELDLPFCLCWANEYWTNGWVSAENTLLIAHDNSCEQDWIDHFYYFLPFFKDARYIKVDRKPLLIIYFPDILQRCNEMIDCWRKLAKENGFEDLYILYQKAMTHFNNDVDKSHFDGGIEFQPGYSQVRNQSTTMKRYSEFRIKLATLLRVKLHINLSHKTHGREKHMDYDSTWEDIINTRPDNINMYPGAFVDWDNTPRKGTRGSLYDKVNPEKFKNYLSRQIINARDNYHKDMLFLFAWNEWGESGYLEPDEKYGYGNLEAIRDALTDNDELPTY